MSFPFRVVQLWFPCDLAGRFLSLLNTTFKELHLRNYDTHTLHTNRLSVPCNINLEKRPRFCKKFRPLVGCPPLVGQFRRPPFPRLQVHGGPNHVEESKSHLTNIFDEFSSAVKEHLKSRGERTDNNVKDRS